MGNITGNSDHPGAPSPAVVNGAANGAAHDLAMPQDSDNHASSLYLGETGSRPADATRQARRLIAAANDLLALAAELEELSRHGHSSGPAFFGPASVGDATPAEAHALMEDDARWLRSARRTYRDRRSRAAVFGDETLFGEPAWDLLLDLFIAAKERKRVPVTSACIGASVPTTTALRWLAVLEERGLVLREADPSDARRIFVRLSADAYARMVAYFVRAAMNDAEDTIESARTNGRALERLRS